MPRTSADSNTAKTRPCRALMAPEQRVQSDCDHGLARKACRKCELNDELDLGHRFERSRCESAQNQPSENRGQRRIEQTRQAGADESEHQQRRHPARGADHCPHVPRRWADRRRGHLAVDDCSRAQAAPQRIALDRHDAGPSAATRRSHRAPQAAIPLTRSPVKRRPPASAERSKRNANVAATNATLSTQPASTNRSVVRRRYAQYIAASQTP